MKIDDAIMFFEKAAEASARLGTEKLELGAIAHIAYDTYSQIAEWLKELKQRRTIDAVSEWIPCSERLPSEQGQYLVTTYAYNDYHYVDVLSFHKGKFYETDSEWGDVVDNGVVAWMPLPKPYGERKESE